jgi:hypothetical protein
MFVPPNKSLQRSGGRWYLVCKSLAVIDKVPVISLGEPPAAELSRWATTMRHLLIPMAVSALLAVQPSKSAAAEPAASERQACSTLQKFIAKRDALPESGPVGIGWFCEFSSASDKSWVVIALRSNRKCDAPCSNLMG